MELLPNFFILKSRPSLTTVRQRPDNLELGTRGDLDVISHSGIHVHTSSQATKLIQHVVFVASPRRTGG